MLGLHSSQQAFPAYEEISAFWLRVNENESIFCSHSNSSYAEKFFAQERLCAGYQYDGKNIYGGK